MDTGCVDCVIPSLIGSRRPSELPSHMAAVPALAAAEAAVVTFTEDQEGILTGVLGEIPMSGG